MTYTTPEPILREIAGITDIDQARHLILIADHIIGELHESVQELKDDIAVLEEEATAEHADAERYTLLKFLLPNALKKAAALGPRFVESFVEEEIDQIDFFLDKSIEHGVLDAFRAAFEQKELQEQAQQAAYAKYADPEGEDGPLMAYGIPAQTDPLPAGIISDEY